MTNIDKFIIPQGDIKLSEAEAVFKVHILGRSSCSNTVVVGWQKVQSRKKSFEALVQWLGPYMADVVKRLAQEKETSTSTPVKDTETSSSTPTKENDQSEVKPVPVNN